MLQGMQQLDCLDLVSLFQTLPNIWIVLQAIQLKDCDVYSYKSEGDADPFGEAQFGQLIVSVPWQWRADRAVKCPWP